MTRKEKIGFYSIGVNVLLREAYETNPFAGEEKGKGIKMSEWLLEKGVDTVYSPKGFEGKGPGYVFSGAGVDIMLTGNQDLPEIQEDLQKNKGAEPALENHELKGEKRDD